jgi:hypothetical protein
MGGLLSEVELVKISVKRKKGKIFYEINCAKEVTGEELAHYLDGIIEGICNWKPEVCQEAEKSVSGTIN